MHLPYSLHICATDSAMSGLRGLMCSNPMGLVSSNVRKAGHSGCFARRSERVLRISGVQASHPPIKIWDIGILNLGHP